MITTVQIRKCSYCKKKVRMGGNGKSWSWCCLRCLWNEERVILPQNVLIENLSLSLSFTMHFLCSFSCGVQSKADYYCAPSVSTLSVNCRFQVETISKSFQRWLNDPLNKRNFPSIAEMKLFFYSSQANSKMNFSLHGLSTQLCHFTGTQLHCLHS